MANDSVDATDDGLALVKYFTPGGSWSWYAASFDGDDTFYGVVDGHEIEFGFFSLRELESYRSRLGNRIERDRYFTPSLLFNIHRRLCMRRWTIE